MWLQFAEYCFFYISYILTVLSGLKPRMRAALFWVITQRVVIIPYQWFGATYRSHLQGSRNGLLTLKKGADGLYRNFREELPLLAAFSREERSSHVLRGGSLKPGIF